MLMEFEFEELPLREVDGFEILPADGIATIDYGRDGRWVVSGIKLRGRRQQATGVVRQHFAVDKTDRDAQRIEMVLLTKPEWIGQVQDRVDEALRNVENLEDPQIRSRLSAVGASVTRSVT